MSNEEQLNQEFDRDMYAGLDLLKRECGYNATYFLRMLREHGGVGTAKRLLVSSEFQTGLTRLWEEGQLRYSMENQVLQRKYRCLFTAEERASARKRLHDLNFTPEEW